MIPGINALLPLWSAGLAENASFAPIGQLGELSAPCN